MALQRHRRVALHFAMALALTLTGCKPGSTLPEAPQIPNTTSSLFSITVEGPQYVAIGQKIALEVQGEDEEGVPVSDALTATWKVSDAKTAQIDAQGNVTGLKKGTVTVTATTKTPPREATFQVTVLGPGETAPEGSDYPDIPDYTDPDGYVPPTGGELPEPSGPSAPAGIGLTVFPAKPVVAVGGSLRLFAYQGEAGWEAPSAAVWRSSDASVATVDEAGLVTGLKAGTVTIQAGSVAYPSLRTSVKLTVSAPAKPTDVKGITIRPSNVVMNVGETFWLDAEVPTWAGGYDPNIRWVVNSQGIVEVTETGQITALAPGKTTVTAIAATYDRGNLSATIPVEVRNTAGSR